MTINVWSDSMQHIELLGKPALFSDSRVDRSTVPDGWYVYDLRGSDYDPDLISTLEARVIVNYAGSILTPEPVIFPDGQDYLDVKGQTDFLDEEITLIDFCRQHEMPIPSRYQIRPASFDEAGLFYAMKPEEDQRLGCIGHVRMDFGHRGKEFWHTWWPRGPEELNSPEFKAELQQVVDELHTGVLKDLSSMSKYCWSHGGEVGNWPSNYGYIVETENYRYCLRCNPVPGDYQAYLTAFDLRVQRQNLAEQAAVIGRVTFASGEQQEYADEGITGTSAKKRKAFLQMIRDCERGKIDLVITKSVSRFCRNTLDGLNYVRRLKRHGVGVYFEKENVNTLFMDNEMILTFMMSQAQAESESLSGNVRWGHRKNFKDGKVYYHCKNFLGYRWGADGQPEIDPEQAAIVRRIFSRFLLGHSVRQITTDLMADGIKTATGKTVWHDSVVQKMLCNEKYIGDALLQKTYIADLFTREKRVNNGELPKYYVHDCHPAIIDRETFQKVQEEIARRSSLKKTSSKAKTQLGKYCGKYVLSELLVCGECGSPYRRVIWTQKGVKRVVWRCQNRLEHGRKICKQSPTLDEGDIHDAVISAMNELFRMQAAKDAVKAGIAAVLAGEEQTMSLPAVELQIRNLQERQLELFQLIVSAGADCTDYDEELQQVNIAKTRLMAQKAELEKEQRGAAAFESRLAELDMALEQASGTLTDFDELTVRQLVSNIKVLDKDSLLICFKDGTEITQAMQRRQAA